MPRMNCDVVAALLGPPNSGKTSLFNALTGSAEKVANWPGVTVEVRTAVMRLDSRRVCLVDLPGTYGLSGSGPEERVTRDFLLRERVDVAAVTVDATNPEHGLYLALEVRETGIPSVIALTKMDGVEPGSVDVRGLEEDLGAPVVPTSSMRGWGLGELAKRLSEPPRQEPLRIDYGDLEPYIERLESMLARCFDRHSRWMAVRLLEGLDWARRLVEERCGDTGKHVLDAAEEMAAEYRGRTGREPLEAAVSARYRVVEEIVSKRFRSRTEAGLTRLDRLFLHPVWGVAASLALLALLFLTVFTVNTGFPLNLLLDSLGFHAAARMLEEYSLSGILGALFDTLASLVEHSIGGWLGELLGQGVIGGVGLVLSFLPLIVIIYAVFGALEDSGLAARMALAYEPLMEKFGVTGRAIFPFIMSLGCNVPAVFSTRILETWRERVAVALAVPFIPCQARLVVLLAFIAAFFSDNPAAAAAVALGIYLLAFTVALLTARLATSTMGGREEELGVMELPRLKKPSMRVIWWRVKEATIHFLVRAGTVILVFSVLAWLASSFTPSLTPAATPEESIAAALGKALAPLASMVFGVAHWQAWRLAFGFLEGLAAKEVFLDALAMVAPPNVKVATPADAVAYLHLTLPQAVSVLVALTLYMPCIATLAAIYGEFRSLKLVTASLAYSIAVATAAALLVRIALTPLAP